MIRRGEAEFASLSASTPSAAGYYFDETGGLVVQVRDSADHASARAAIARLLEAHAIGTDARWKGIVIVHPADYTFYQLATWRDSVFEHVLGRFAGVTRLDLDEKTNRVSIGLAPGSFALRRDLPAILTNYGIDTNAVIFVTTAGARSSSQPATSEWGFVGGDSITSHADTLIGGIKQIAISSAGYVQSTIGVVLNYGGTRSVLTCSHCTKTAYSPDPGDTLYQPSLGYGYESADPSTSTCGTWPFTFSCRNSDAAIITLFSGDISEVGLIARTTYSSHSTAGSKNWDTVRPYFIITGTISNPGVGTDVQKMGITTGWTYGTITGTCVDIVNNDEHGIKVLCNTEADYYSEPGDSGAPVFVWDGVNSVSFVGIHALRDGSHRYFSPLSQIDNDLTSSMSIARTTSLSAPSISGTVSSSHPSISWSGVSGATRYELYRTWCVWSGASCSSGSNGWQYIGTIYSTSYLDAEMVVSSYNGSTVPGILNYGYVGYQLAATNTKDLSTIGNAIYFVLSP